MSEDFALAAPPPGVIPDFAHPDTIAWQIYVAYGICIPFILIFTGLWLWARLSGARKTLAGFIEALFLGTVLGIISYCTLAVALAASNVTGRYPWEILFKDLTKDFFVLSLLTATFIFIWLCLIKICIFMLYLELFGRLRWMQICCWAGIIITSLWSLAGMLGWLIPCAPRGNRRIDWLMGTSSPRCQKSQHVVLLHGSMNVITDFYMIALPLPAVWNLQMPVKKKIGICTMFLTGLVGLVASILALFYRIQLIQSWKPPADPNNLLRLSVANYIVNIVEMTASILIFCMPSLVGLLRRYRDPLQRYTSRMQRLLLCSRASKTSLISPSLSNLEERSASLHSVPEMLAKGSTPKRTLRILRHSMHRPTRARVRNRSSVPLLPVTNSVSSPPQRYAVMISSKDASAT